MALAFYRKKMMIVNAVFYNGDNIDEIVSFVGDENLKQDGELYYLLTLEGYMPLCPGYYVIEGVDGEFYRLSADRMKKRHTKISNNKYIKKPLIIKAFRYTGKNLDEVLAFTNGLVISIDDQLHIFHHECPMSFDHGNYIIESDDEHIKYYVHRHGIFERAHHKVEKLLIWKTLSMTCCAVFEVWGKAYDSWEKFTQKISK